MARNFIKSIIEAIKRFLEKLKNFVKRIINGILNFIKEVVNYFKALKLVKDKDIPFIADADQFKEMIKDAPVKNVGIFEGTLNAETDEIENVRYIAADEVDEQTEEVMNGESVVVLC